MARYSVAISKDRLSSLIDKALSGEEVIITRHGTPTVELRAVQRETGDRTRAMDDLDALRRSLPKIPVSSAELLRREKQDYRY